jgi:branched-chain amino acid transport system substrate-binding protein
LAEQLAVKAFVPTLALSGDRALTNVNIPWIFRMPAETSCAGALRVLLEAAAQSGPNRARLRDVLSAGPHFDRRGEALDN